MAHVSFPVWITLLLVAWPPCFFGVLHPPHRGFCTALDLSPKHSEVAAAAVLQHRVLKHRKQGRLLDKIEVSLQSEPSEMFRDIFWFNVYVGKDRIRMHADIYTDTYTDTNTLYITISEISRYHMVLNPKQPP